MMAVRRLWPGQTLAFVFVTVVAVIIVVVVARLASGGGSASSRCIAIYIWTEFLMLRQDETNPARKAYEQL